MLQSTKDMNWLEYYVDDVGKILPGADDILHQGMTSPPENCQCGLKYATVGV